MTEYESGNVYQLPGYEYFEGLNLFVFHLDISLLDYESQVSCKGHVKRNVWSSLKILILDGVIVVRVNNQVGKIDENA